MSLKMKNLFTRRMIISTGLIKDELILTAHRKGDFAENQ